MKKFTTGEVAYILDAVEMLEEKQRPKNLASLTHPQRLENFRRVQMHLSVLEKLRLVLESNLTPRAVIERRNEGKPKLS